MISLTQLKKIFAVLAAFSTLLSIHSSYAQAADVTFSSTVSSSTCYLSIVGSGATAGGFTTNTITMPAISTSNTNALSGAAIGSALAAPTRFTLGFVTSTVGSSTNCAYGGLLNVAFKANSASSTVALVSPRVGLKTTTSDGTNAAIEIESTTALGVVTKAINDYATTPTYTAGKSSQHDLVSVVTGTVLNFQVTPVKAIAPGTAVGAGSLGVKVDLTVNYP